MSALLLFKRLKNWGIKSVVSSLDHGVFSGANFILSILLARWLLPSHYGVYSIAFAVYQFAYQAHNAILLEPMSVLGPSRMHHRLMDYLRDQVKLHFVISFFAGLTTCVLGIVVLTFNQVLGQVLIIMGLVLSFILLPLLMRRGFYVLGKPELALLGSVTYAIILCVELWMIKTLTNLSVQLAFPIIGLAGLMSGLYLIKLIPPQRSALVPITVTWFTNWKYGKWLVYSSLLIALAAQAQTFVVGAVLGLSDAGAFRALQNFIQPIILFFTAISALVLPSLSYDFGTGNIPELKRKVKYLFGLFLLVSVSFALFLSLYAETLEVIVYNGKFSSYVYLIPIWGLVPIAAVLTYVYYFLLQSIQRPRAILYGSLIWSVTSAILSIVFSVQWGILGATISVIMGYFVGGIAYVILYRYYISVSSNVRSS